MNRTPRAWAARLGVSAAAALTLGATALPAHADDTLPPSVNASLNQTITLGGPGSHGKGVPVWVDANRVTGVKVAFDLSGLAGVATVTFQKNCTAAGAVETCTFPDAAELHEIMPITLSPAAGAKAGDHGTISYTASADGISGNTFTSTVTLADGVDMVMLSGGGKSGTAKPRDTLGVPVEFMNAGNQSTDGYQITLFFDHGLVPDTYTNCTYGDDHTTHVVVCTFDDPADAVAPGEAVQMDDFGVTVAADAYGWQGTDFRVDGLTAGNAARASVRMSPRSGGKTLHVKQIVRPRAMAKVTDIDDGDNWGFADWNVANTLDLATIGATVSGKVGDVAPVTVGVKNNGPATLDGTRAGEPVAIFIFQIPPGTQVTSAPQSCASVIDEGGTQREEPGQAGGTYYRCRSGDYLAAGNTFSAAFKLKITNVTPDATGTVAFSDRYASPPDWFHDANPGNDKALVVINPATGGTGGGSTTGSLPITGAQTGLLVAGSVVLLGGGGAMYLLARRRRVVLVADGNDSAS